MMRLAGGTRRLFLLVALVALSSVVYIEAHTKQVSAAGSSPVVIAVDVTNTSACQVTYHLNTGWHGAPPPGAKPLVPWTKTLPCAAGTIIKTAVVPLAKALAAHERYAPLPAHPQAPTAAEHAAIQAVLDAKHQALASGRSALIPDSGCGVDSYASLYWSEQGVDLESDVWWYRTSDCSTVFVDEGQFAIGWYANYGDTFGDINWDWDYDAYYNDNWTHDLVMPPSTYSYWYPNATELPQHWYRQSVSEWQYGNFNQNWLGSWATYVAVCN